EAPTDREASLRLTAMLLGNRAFRGEPVELPDEIPAGETLGERALLAAVAFARALQTMAIEDAVGMAGAAWANGRLLAEVGTENNLPTWHAINAAIYSGAIPEAVAWCDQLRDEARRSGSVIAYTMALGLRSFARFRGGEVGEALADVHEVMGGFKTGALAVPFASPPGEKVPLNPTFLTYVGETLIEADELDLFDAELRVLGLDGSLRPHAALDLLLFRRGKLRVAQGELERGLEDFVEAGKRLGRISGVAASWRSETALALAALDRRDDAKELVMSELEQAQQAGLS